MALTGASSKRPLLIWGATGQARVIAEFAERLGYRIVALIDRSAEVQSPFPGVPIHRSLDDYSRGGAERPSDIACVVAIGGIGAMRLAVQTVLEQAGIEPVSLIHPTAFVAANARVGAGSQILANASVCAEASLGRACIVNTKASVDHECNLADGVHIAPGATLAGCVEVGESSFVGAGAVVLPRIRIGRDVVIGAGSVVTRNVPDGHVVVGNPARFRRVNQTLEERPTT